jgi:heme/copper-type cytochrome/quinol oxidase subunit 2
MKKNIRKILFLVFLILVIIFLIVMLINIYTIIKDRTFDILCNLFTFK